MAMKGDPSGLTNDQYRQAFGGPEEPTELQLLREKVEAMESMNEAIGFGERSHILTVGSPARGLCLRITMGRLDRHGKFHDWQPDIFLIWRGRRVEL